MLTKRTKLMLEMTNSDHSIDEGLAEALREDPNTYTNYYGWNFIAYVWFDKMFHAEVWQYHQHKEIISADSLEEIMTKVSDSYGWD